MKKFMLFLAAFLMIISPLAAAQAMSVTWEWLLDDPEVNYYRYQLDGQAEDGWTTVDGTVSSYTVDGLDPYSTYTLYLQRSYDGIYWSPSAEAVAEPLLVEDVPESADITPVLEPAVDVVEEVPAEEVVSDEVKTAGISLVVDEEAVEEPVLEAPTVAIVPEVAPSYVAEEPVAEPIEVIGEEFVVDVDNMAIGEEEKVMSVEDIIVVEDEEEVEEELPVVEDVPAVEEPVVEELAVEEPVAEEPVVEEVAPVEEEVIETPVVVEEVPDAVVEAAKNDFRFSLLLKGGANVPLDFANKIQPMPLGLTATVGFDFANIVRMGNSVGLGIRTDVGVSLIPNANGWGTQIKPFSNLFKMGSYAYTVDPAVYVTLDAMAGIVDFTFGAGFSGGIMFPHATSARAEQYSYAHQFGDAAAPYRYKLAPAALLGMRFYCGDVFSIGVEGTYRATVGDWMHHDVTANLVMGFSF